jgi:hypothetical protein
MTEAKVTWYVDRDPDGSVSRVIRVHDDGSRLWGEYLRDGAWFEDPVVLNVLTDSTWGTQVTPTEGDAIARSFGVGS